jgi:hypothetical protein
MEGKTKSPSLMERSRSPEANPRGAIVSRRREQRHAVREMRVDPSEPLCRGRFQTAISCYGPMAAVVNVMVKRRDNLITSCGDERDGCKRTADDASKGRNGIKTGESLCPGKSMAETCLLVIRCPVYRRRESHPGFRTELENLAGDGKGKGASG